ncbi:MAG: ABC transporter ATP-binding protein [Alphaproteobacteria bacterium]|nr:ABC transporter ATP-binding protein [Alphaproteobacteria bacterium]
MTGVRFSGVSKRFGAVAALDSLDLAIEAGEFVSLLGPSGSGKSTTLNLLAGLIDADAGEIRIGERVVNDLPPDQRDLAMVFQNYALYPHMTVFENVAFPLRARGRSAAEAEIEARVKRVAGMLGVTELLARYPRELSGGQQQRVALGRAMVREPKVFLLDEPLSNLDARLRIRMRRDIKALHEQIRSTIVYVTHDQAEAMTLSTRIAVFDKGRLQQFDAPEAIYNRPANVFVANFVGEREIALLAGRVERDGADARFHGAGYALLLTGAGARLAPAAGRAATIGVRAEAVAVSADGPGAPATVAMTELSGPDRIVYARIAGGPEIACRAEPRSTFASGQDVRLRFDPERLHAFDPGTTLSLIP